MRNPRENEDVARATKKAADPWEYYRSIQLTPEQKAAARKALEAQSEDAARNCVWEKFLELEGNVHVEYDLDELREDRD